MMAACGQGRYIACSAALKLARYFRWLWLHSRAPWVRRHKYPAPEFTEEMGSACGGRLAPCCCAFPALRQIYLCARHTEASRRI